MARDHNYFVYIIECADGLYYTGITNNLERRLAEHNEGRDQKSFTYKRRPVALKYAQRFSDVNQAIGWEKQLKGWNRKKKEALFKEDWEEVKRLAQIRAGSQSSSTLRLTVHFEPFRQYSRTQTDKYTSPKIYTF